MINSVTALTTKTELTLIPDVVDGTNGSDREFEVTVINNSDRFASFQLELIAPGLDPQADLNWYRVEPEICAKQPPGDRTTFHVTLLKPPIPAYGMTINLTLRAFSVEFANLFTSQTLYLRIEKPRRSLKVQLPTKIIKGFPNDITEIPVLVNHLSSKSTEITLSLLKLEPSWFPQGTVQSLRLEPGDSQTVSFWCQASIETALSQSYDFTVEAHSNTSNYAARDQGRLEVLPQGTIEFYCEAPQQTIPARKGRSRRNTATYELKFINASNLAQQVTLHLLEADQQRCGLITPDRITLAAGEAQSLYLTARKQRPWLGDKRRYAFEVVPQVTAPATIEPSHAVQVHPSDRTLELQVLPRIPLWLQLGGALLALVMLWSAIAFAKIGHQSAVNFVRFSGDGTTVLSASSDQTLRRWQTNNTRFQPESLQFWQLRQLTAPVDVGEKIGKAVRIFRHRPEDNDVAAIGLEDGTVQLWDLSRLVPLQSIYSGTDRVFDLVFTQDSKTLFSAHGSGNVYARFLNSRTVSGKTARRIGNPEFAVIVPQENRVRFLFPISALALSEDQQPSLVVVGGQFSRLALWDWQNQQVYAVPYNREVKADDFPRLKGKQQSINSLAVAKDLLATADSEGLITLWNMNQVRQCYARPNVKSGIASDDPDSAPCRGAVIKQWQAGQNAQAIRAVALSKNACYLASAGDDGEVVLVPLSNGRPQLDRRKVLGRFQQGVQSVDITVQGNEILVTSDAEGDRVMLYRITKEGAYANCQ